MKYALVLDSLQDVQKFSEIVQQIDADVRLLGRDENGSPWELSAKSVFCTVLLGYFLFVSVTEPTLLKVSLSMFYTVVRVNS